MGTTPPIYSRACPIYHVGFGKIKYRRPDDPNFPVGFHWSDQLFQEPRFHNGVIVQQKEIVAGVLEGSAHTQVVSAREAVVHGILDDFNSGVLSAHGLRRPISRIL